MARLDQSIAYGQSRHGHIKIEQKFCVVKSMSMYRHIKHFVVTWENGMLRVSQAREIIPNRTYEIIQTPKPFSECIMNFAPPQIPSLPKVNCKGLGESVKKNSLLS